MVVKCVPGEGQSALDTICATNQACCGKRQAGAKRCEVSNFWTGVQREKSTMPGCQKVGSWTLLSRMQWRPFFLLSPSTLRRRRIDWSAAVMRSAWQSSAGLIPAHATTGQLPSRHNTLSVASPTYHHTGSPSRPSQAAACFGLGEPPFCLPARGSADTLCVSFAVAGQSSVRRDEPRGAAEPIGTEME